MRFLKNRLGRFGSDEKGQLLVEALMVLPILIWGLIGLFTYWDAYRTVNTFQKASYSVSDILSRIQSVDMTYLDGLQDTVEYLLATDQEVRMRVTSVTWSETNERFEVLWSRSPNSAMTQLDTSSLQAFAERIPEMTDGNTVVIVETELDHQPSFSVGVSDQTFYQFIVTRPRFYHRVELTV